VGTAGKETKIELVTGAFCMSGGRFPSFGCSETPLPGLGLLNAILNGQRTLFKSKLISRTHPASNMPFAVDGAV
jgi:hypothetical protein